MATPPQGARDGLLCRGRCHRGTPPVARPRGPRSPGRAGALIAFGALGQPWWLVPAAILAPDIAMSGYLAGTRPGAHLYNLTHATPLPAIMLGAGYWQANRLLMALVWLAHIGLDRLLGTGLKYNDRFTHTHLGDRPDAR